MTHLISARARTSFNINLAALIPFMTVIVTGLVLQVGYHMHGFPDTVATLGLGRCGWLWLHRAAAVISLAIISAHCFRHRKHIAMVTKKRLYMKKPSPVLISYYLIVFVPTTIAALASWAFTHGHARFMLVELHDKLGLLMTAVFTAHLATRAGWMVRTYRALASERRGWNQKS